MRYMRIIIPNILIIFTSILLVSCGTFKDPREDEYNEFMEKKKPLIITSNQIYGVNSAGGASVRIVGKNLSKKTIKYISYTVKAYNAVGDSVKGEIKRSSLANLGDTGPMKSMDSIGGVWKNVWYNSTINCMVITKVEIEYMDGSRKNYIGPSRVRSVISSEKEGAYGEEKNPENSCKYKD